MAALAWFKHSDKSFYAEAFLAFVSHWYKCIHVAGNVLKYKCSFYSLEFVLLFYKLPSPGLTSVLLEY